MCGKYGALDVALGRDRLACEGLEGAIKTIPVALVAILAWVVVGCGGSAPTPRIIYVAVTASPTSIASLEPVATAAAARLNLSEAFPAASEGPTWRAIVPDAAGDPFVSVGGLQPPAGVYILDWSLSKGCPGLFSNDVDIWSWGSADGIRLSGLDLVDLSAEYPYEASTFSDCAPWVLEVEPLGTWFGPNSVQVARLLIQLRELGPTWNAVDRESVASDAVALESIVLDAAKRDPNLGAAVQHAISEDWYRGNRYVLDQVNAAHLRRLSILAEVAQPLLSASDFDMLYGPMAGYIDPLSLGLPTTP